MYLFPHWQKIKFQMVIFVNFQIMCFTAFSIVSLVTAIVSIQLLRLGLVNHTTDGNTFQKENKVNTLTFEQFEQL